MSNVGTTLVLRACASLHFTIPNGGPGGWTFRFQSGDFLAPIFVAGVGDISVDFLPGNGFIAGAGAIKATPRVVLAPSGLVSIGVQHTSATRKRFTILQEQGGGAASAPADLDFDFQVWTQPGI